MAHKVAAGRTYRYQPVMWDQLYPPFGVVRGFLRPGDEVRVVKLPLAPPPNTMGMAHVETLDGQLAGLVHANSLEPSSGAVADYYGGHGREVLADMRRRYGKRHGREVFYATARKRGLTPSHDEDEGPLERWLEKQDPDRGGPSRDRMVTHYPGIGWIDGRGHGHLERHMGAESMSDGELAGHLAEDHGHPLRGDQRRMLRFHSLLHGRALPPGQGTLPYPHSHQGYGTGFVPDIPRGTDAAEAIRYQARAESVEPVEETLPSRDAVWDPDDELAAVEAEGPQEEDWVTNDHRTVWLVGNGRKVLEVGEDQDFDLEVEREMERQGYFPNVWYCSDHGNCSLIPTWKRQAELTPSGRLWAKHGLERMEPYTEVGPERRAAGWRGRSLPYEPAVPSSNDVRIGEKVDFRPGETHPITVGHSEVAMHMRVAGQTLPVKLLEGGRAAQIHDAQGKPFSAPVGVGEAGIYRTDDGRFYGYNGEHSHGGEASHDQLGDLRTHMESAEHRNSAARHRQSSQLKSWHRNLHRYAKTAGEPYATEQYTEHERREDGDHPLSGAATASADATRDGGDHLEFMASPGPGGTPSAWDKLMRHLDLVHGIRPPRYGPGQTLEEMKREHAQMHPELKGSQSADATRDGTPFQLVKVEQRPVEGLTGLADAYEGKKRQGWSAILEMGGFTYHLSRLDGESEWTADALFGANGYPHFVNGFGARYLRTQVVDREAYPEVVAALEAAVKAGGLSGPATMPSVSQDRLSNEGKLAAGGALVLALGTLAFLGLTQKPSAAKVNTGALPPVNTIPPGLPNVSGSAVVGLTR